MECPECFKFFRGDRCYCGWSPKEAQPVYLRCAHCEEAATIRLKDDPVCVNHYKQITLERAVQYCQDAGLDTLEKQIEAASPKLAALLSRKMVRF